MTGQVRSCPGHAVMAAWRHDAGCIMAWRPGHGVMAACGLRPGVESWRYGMRSWPAWSLRPGVESCGLRPGVMPACGHGVMMQDASWHAVLDLESWRPGHGVESWP